MTRSGRLRAAARRVLPRTLRARLTCGLVVLLALGCAAVGIAAVVTLRSFLTQRLDQQIAQAGGTFPASLEHRGRGEPDADNPHGDTRRQTPGTFGARLLDGKVTAAGVVRSGAGTSVRLTAGDEAAIAAVPVDGGVHRLHLSALGDYRVKAVDGDDGDVLVTGLPLDGVEDAVTRLLAVEGGVFGGALLVAGAAGAFWVRWSLRPLRRVADTATAVTALPLASGEVTLPDRVPDTDPRTEVGRVGIALNRMLGHVEGALGERHASQERLRRFAADASHELRTPVASVRGHAELARLHPGPVPPGVARALERITAESVRMGGMVDDLLLLARLDAGRPLAAEPVDLTRLVLDAVDDARAAGPDHRWELDLPEEPVVVAGDPLRLQQVAGNLLGNARRHTPPGTRVTVRLRQGGDGTRFQVEDDGPGIPEGVRDTVFERFARADHTRPEGAGGGAGPEGHGAGLGLAIVEAVATAHGGTADVRSRPGATVFTVTLPLPHPSQD
ncbi:putative two-component system sensor kinase [Actinacidiphila reveromycinica]|uniref:histidine kinase n=1 Tax=Actinacidiphila reveromycinica TaxID=659352 RepID=A0A7U3VLM1_9ACTN|nr:HAMP domain-containing sensor histidine kinase [Streptomyces sp. SN-593]BBA95664.1 putative two-component system sensor kinase [Streptomyces sp. SN-593]